jgi:sugar transferase (PEP-CTERM/EpsH1 system associated)
MTFATPKRLKVLVVTYGTPYPPTSGVKIRDFNLLRQISRSVTLYLCVLATENSIPDLSELRTFCAQIKIVPATPRTPLQAFSNSISCWKAGHRIATHPYFYPELARAIRDLIIEEQIDILQIEHSFLAAYRSAVPMGSQCRTILSLHNIGSNQYQRIARTQTALVQRVAYSLKSFLITRMEKKSIAEFDHCLVVSPQEGRLLENAVPATTFSVIENGIDCANIRFLAQPTNGKELLFIGVIGYPPNADAVLYFYKSILPLIRREIPEIRLTVVGNAPSVEIQRLASSDGISVTGYVDYPTPYYARASVCIVPLRAGGGTRLKILEAMAFGRPVVTTSIGCEGLEVRDGQQLLVGDTAEDFARQVLALLREPELRCRISTAARRLVEQHYDWPIIADKLLQTYHALMSRPR